MTPEIAEKQKNWYLHDPRDVFSLMGYEPEDGQLVLKQDKGPEPGLTFHLFGEEFAEEGPDDDLYYPQESLEHAQVLRLRDRLNELYPPTQDAKGLRPLHNKVVVKPIEPEEKTAGGILLPQVAQDKPSEGIVVAVGPGLQLDNGTRAPISVKISDHILFGRYAGKEIERSGEKLQLISETDILGIFERQPELTQTSLFLQAEDLDPAHNHKFTLDKAALENAESVSAEMIQRTDGGQWLVVTVGHAPSNSGGLENMVSVTMIPVNEQAQKDDERAKALLSDVLPALNGDQFGHP